MPIFKFWTTEGKTKTLTNSDLVIAIMGPTGSGKSTFINTLMAKDVATVGNTLQSCTAKVQSFIFPNPSVPKPRIVIVDTPGFNDTYLSDFEILSRISKWMAESYSANMKLAGLIYLHKINENRMEGSAKMSLEMFAKLCGTKGTEKVILATTMWGEGSSEAAESREKQLKEGFWKPMIDKGATPRRFDCVDQRSAEEMVTFLLAKNAHDPIRIQKELVTIGKSLPETGAGRVLATNLNERLKQQTKKSEHLREATQFGMVVSQGELNDADEKIRLTIDQLNNLKNLRSGKLKRFLHMFSTAN